jgi:hypothetical protein
MRSLRVMALLLLAGSVGLAPASAGSKLKKPRLRLRAIPIMAMAPVEVTVLIDLDGGDDLEDYYCPEIEVEWDDGAKSVQESDCPPFEPGTAITRHYSLSHSFRRSGLFEARVRLRRAGRVVAASQVNIRVQAGLGEGF